MATHLQTKLVKIKKPHTCWGCCNIFPVGCILKYSTGIYEGEFWSGYWCTVCDNLFHSDLDFGNDGIAEGDIINEYHEEWIETAKNMPLFIMEKSSWPK